MVACGRPGRIDMTIPVDTPQCSVVLFKMVSRVKGVAARYAGANRQVDLTPYLGDGGAVQTTRNLTDPAGSFTVQFPDQPNPQIQDSVYALIEPMDMIEIRMARNASIYPGGKLPINMRGFVSTIRRVETVGDDGSPQRSVVITGQNFGKLWQINSVFWQVAYAQDTPLLTLYKVDAILGMTVGFESVSKFVSDMVTIVMNKKIADISAFANRQVLPFTALCSVNQGQVTPAASATLSEGSLWDILTAFQDSPWNELFIQDAESGPEVVFRPAPFKDVNGNLIMPEATDPGTVSIDISDVVSQDMSRTDTQVANFFWVDPSSTSLDTNGIVTAANIVDSSLLDFQHPNNNPILYGYRQMQGSTMLFPDGLTQMPSDVSPDDEGAESTGFPEWWKTRALQMMAMNRDNSVFEQGQLSLKGNETLKPGMYLKVQRGALASESYMTAVTHNYVPFQSYTTDVTFERGNGFIVRDNYPGSPFWAEGRQGPYTETLT
jgi:hypothetical protein